MQPVTQDSCAECGHAFGRHLVIALNGDPMDGGVMLCPENECLCATTWSVGDSPQPEMPSGEKLAVIRSELKLK
jgi:hypothetical protein